APGLASADQQLATAAKSALELDRAAAAKSLAAAGKQIASLREEISKQGGDNAGVLWELARVRDRIDLALTEVVALPIKTQAERHELVAGETFSVEANFLDQSAAPVKWTIDKSSL